MRKTVLLILMVLARGLPADCQEPAFKVLVISTHAADHSAMIAAAKPALTELAARNGFAIDFTQDMSQIDDAFLARYQVLVQLHTAPFEMPLTLREPFQRFIEQGKGWVGIHAAGLTGRQFEDPKAGYWQWFETFFGGVTYSPHPAFQKATVVVEDRAHPATKNLPARFEISDEWYEFDRSPRANVHVLATVDESTYKQTRPMGDHPIIWCNERYGKAIYIGIGHSPAVWSDLNYSTLVRDAILWAGSKSCAAKVLVLAEHDANHAPMVDAARPFIAQLARQHNFTAEFAGNLDRISDASLSGYQLIIQLNWTPIGWSETQQKAFQHYIERGKGWVGLHHAGLTGDRVLSKGQRNWDWFQNVFLGARYADYITPPVTATIRVEDRSHPATKNLPASFQVSNDEWYEFDKSPRSAAHILATVDESTYGPKKPMGDHPVIWSNEKYGRMIYIMMGHDPAIYQNQNYTTLLRDAILWAIAGNP